MMSILEKIEQEKVQEKDNDGDVNMTGSTMASKQYLSSLSKRSKAVDIAELKLSYED